MVDANVLLYATNRHDPRRDAMAAWLRSALNGATRVGLPWQTLAAFLRISTNPRAAQRPLTPEEACERVRGWMSAPAAWIPVATDRHGDVLMDLVRRHRLAGPIISDAQLAALAIEHGVPVCSTDGDFARFPEITWLNPLAGDAASQ